MDLDRFDRLAQSVARSRFVSRRGLATLLPALALGGRAVDAKSIHETGHGHAQKPSAGHGPARRKRKPSPCKANFKTKQDRSFCKFVRRQCTKSRPFCIVKDPSNGNTLAICCGAGATCCGGKECCGLDGVACCNGQCVATNSNEDCGSCGHACAAGQACQGGTCVDKPHCPAQGCPDGEICCVDHCC